MVIPKVILNRSPPKICEMIKKIRKFFSKTKKPQFEQYRPTRDTKTFQVYWNIKTLKPVYSSDHKDRMKKNTVRYVFDSELKSRNFTSLILII